MKAIPGVEFLAELPDGVELRLEAPRIVREAGTNLDIDLGDVRNWLELPKGMRITTVSRALQRALDEVTKRGMSTQSGREYIIEALNEAGVEVPDEHYVETLVATHDSISRAAAERGATLDSDKVWGYEYVTAGDDRVRDEHSELDGVRLEKDDPFWSQYYPPNGWNCRCKAVPISRVDAEALGESLPSELPDLDAGFDTDFKELLD